MPYTAASFSDRLDRAGFDALQRAGARIRIFAALGALCGIEPTDEQMEGIISAAIRDEAAGKALPGQPLPTGFDGRAGI